MGETIVYLGVGSNLGDKLNNCLRALSQLSSLNNRIQAVSSMYKTEPVGYRNQDWFINCVVMMDTLCSSHELLKLLQTVEKRIGRRKTFKGGPRVIDLDILLFGKEVVNNRELVIPHPRLHERRFVLVPLKELAPSLEHPLLHKTMAELLAEVEDHGDVTLYAPGPSREMFG